MKQKPKLTSAAIYSRMFSNKVHWGCICLDRPYLVEFDVSQLKRTENYFAMILIKPIFIIVVSFLMLNNSIAKELSTSIYPNEKLITLNGFQSLIHFKKGNVDKPLIIFVPGNAHLARIGYGYPDGNPRDFLAYWLNKNGYSFLGVSYPTDNSVYSRVYPEFNIDDWGKLIIGAAKEVITKEGLLPNIIIVGWSMAGSIVQTANAAAERAGLHLDLFVGLSAVPPIPSIMHPSPIVMNDMLPNQLADRRLLFPMLYKLVEEQNNYNGHRIVPKEVYLSQFLGNIPIALGAEGYHFDNGSFVLNVDKTLQESGVLEFSNLPWIAQIHDDAPITMKMSSIDPYAWYFLLTQMLYQNYFKKCDLTALDRNDYNKLNSLINAIPRKLTMTVHGNHLFFVGQKGAKETADKVSQLINSAKSIQKQLTDVTQPAQIAEIQHERGGLH